MPRCIYFGVTHGLSYIEMATSSEGTTMPFPMRLCMTQSGRCFFLLSTVSLSGVFNLFEILVRALGGGEAALVPICDT